MQSLETKIADLLARPGFFQIVHQMAAGLQAGQALAPRLGSLFSTQQRWLMSHLAVSHYFAGMAGGHLGLVRRYFIEAVVEHGLASRNTATAFYTEVLHYGILKPVQAFPSLKNVAEPAPEALSALISWYGLHLSALDGLDGGTRVVRLQEDSQTLLPRMHPYVAHGLLVSEEIRRPAPLYAVFASVDDGGSLMDRLVASVDIAALAEQERLTTGINSVSALARSLNLSRTHAGRTLAAAAASNAVGWSGTAGRSPLWVSRDFVRQYAGIQAAKLLIIDNAYGLAIV
ncbi:hypothetical protein KX729_17225 [Rhizobium sp. XQZ8]|uniref:hypothetical protein n=1 Tax=Rhizobium populisoli TaxID=2859785 RepID=UPI001CA5C243|nr:hypothetical protein [Rhizobium populisoli]MBW6423202.1 hypothetical protein [Rhizobium populisoli]